MNPPHNAKGKPRILIVDDDRNLLASMQRLLAKSFMVDTEQSGAKGLAALSGDVSYAVVVSDLMMPEMNGNQFLARVEKLRPDTMRIMLTGHATMESAIDAINHGHIFQFLLKPVDHKAMESAINRAVRYYKLNQAEKELHALRKLKAAFEGVVAGLAAVIEAKDSYTAGHQARVAGLSVLIAEEMGFGVDVIDAVRVASLVHDIGKVYIPAEFLCKTGPLSREERAVVQMHPKVGHDILAPMDFHWPISEIVLQHHERLDGTGYPGQLRDDEILMEAKIVMVADSVDAMMSDRPYRRGLDLDTAVKEVLKGKGPCYDPMVVDAFIQLVSDVDDAAGLFRRLEMMKTGMQTQ